jgi:hypothetical protein
VEPTPPQTSTPPAQPAATSEPPLDSLPATCAVCGVAREPDDRFCEACGHDFTAPAPAPTGPGGMRGPLLWLFVLFWAALAVGGLIWLYTGLYRL